MTAKEKALELVNKFWDEGLSDRQAKECTLIAVDEILDIVQYNEANVYAFWQEVKEEIELL